MPTGIYNLRQQQTNLVQKTWVQGVKANYVEYLVVAGGGGGGNAANLGCGGGGGGFCSGITPVANGSAITVTVGAGGAANANGANSVFGGVTALGGGTINASGGSGGGATVGAGTPSGSFGQGNDGGVSGPQEATGEDPGGGGGGAGSPGFQGTNDGAGGIGGIGMGSFISGVANSTYSGGGGGCLQNGTYGGAASYGGGGNGQNYNTTTGVAAGSGTVNTGGGGGGGNPSGSGGSGVVIISYPASFAAPTSTTGSPAVSTTGAGSLSFSGSTYLTVAQNTALGFGAGNYTVEAWVYGNFFSAYNTVFDNRGGSQTGIAIYAGTSSTLSVADNSGVVISGGTITTNTWTHIAVVRNGTTVTAYINGTSVGSATDSRTYAASASVFVASNSSGSQFFTGQLTNLRVVKGTAVYTGNFIAPTYPLAPISGTGLLLNAPSLAYDKDFSGNNFSPSTSTGVWSSATPFADGSLQNRVYKWTSSGSITF